MLQSELVSSHEQNSELKGELASYRKKCLELEAKAVSSIVFILSLIYFHKNHTGQVDIDNIVKKAVADGLKENLPAMETKVAEKLVKDITATVAK